MPGLKMTDYKTAVATYVLREDGTYLIECGGWSLAGDELLYVEHQPLGRDKTLFLDDLYQVLQLRHLLKGEVNNE